MWVTTYQKADYKDNPVYKKPAHQASGCVIYFTEDIWLVSSCTPRGWFNLQFLKEKLLSSFISGLGMLGVGGTGVAVVCEVSDLAMEGQLSFVHLEEGPLRLFPTTGISKGLPATDQRPSVMLEKHLGLNPGEVALRSRFAFSLSGTGSE